MPKIKKVKSDELEALGDGWTVATDEDLADSGLTLGEGEVLVIEATEEPEGDDTSEAVRDLQSKLGKANRESASRRLALKNTTAERDRLLQENTTLKNAQAEATKTARKNSAKQLLDTHIAEKKYAFVSDVAKKDIEEAVLAGVDLEKDPSKEVLEALITKVLTDKPYVLSTVTLPPTEAGKQSGQIGPGDVAVDDKLLQEIASDFGLELPSKEK